MKILKSLVFFVLMFIGYQLSAQWDAADSLISLIQKNQIEYHTISARVKCSWLAEDVQTDFQASLRMVKDSLIWGSITGPVGIEMARFLITPDSFRLISPMTKEYMVRDVTYLQRWLSLPLTFAQLQQLLSGQLLILQNSKSAITTKDSSESYLYQENNYLQSSHTLKSSDYTLNQTLLKDKLLDQRLSATFAGADSSFQKVFYNTRDVNIYRGKEQMSLHMEFVKKTINEDLSFPFAINGNYKRVE